MILSLLTAIAAAIGLAIWYTKDLYPKPLKRWLCKLAITNWMRSQPQKFGKKAVLNPKLSNELSLIPDAQEVRIEKPVILTNPALRDEYIIYGTDEENNGLSVKVTRFPNNQTHACVQISLKDATYLVSYKGETPNHYEFSLGNLRLEMVEPFRTWRIWYNGIMTHSSKEDKLVHVTCNFLWKALECPVDNRKNANADLLADHLCRESLFGENFSSLSKIVPEGYSQFGTMHGNINVNDEDVNVNEDIQKELYLYGFRSRAVICSLGQGMLDAFSVGQTREEDLKIRERGNTRRLELFAICDTGNGFRLTAFNDEWTDGRMLWASYEVTSVKHVDCSASQIFRDSTLPKLFNIYDKKGTSRVEIWPAVKTTFLPNNSQVTLLKMSINGEHANGVLIRKSDVITEIYESNKSAQRGGVVTSSQIQSEGLSLGHFPLEKVIGQEDEDSFILDFSHDACLKVPLVGGKGASLAHLQGFVKTLGNSKVKTARGFCISTNLFRDLLDLEKFTQIFSSTNGSDQSLEVACSTVMEMIKSCDAATRISTLISPRIEKTFGEENLNKIRFAVRSSGVLEDGSDLSCAGQNETFLGVPELFISQKIVDCWASLFTVQSVRYRLNHGQPAVSEMGVVIQEMVDAASAGVIFTADPRSGNPFHIIITANYGLGESVVSGSCDPDTITLIRHGDGEGRQRSNGEKCADKFHNRFITTSPNKWWRDVTIGSKVMGEKRTKIICTEANSEDGNSTAEISMADQESRQFCLDEETAIELGSVAAEIELFKGEHKPVDIEWAIDQKGQIFILQCRHLTALDAWTDFEILHELDSATRVKNDRFTTANAGEVLPKALHTLTEISIRCLDQNCQHAIVNTRGGDVFPYTPNTGIVTVIFRQRLFINMFPSFYGSVDKEISTALVCLDQTVFGRQVINEEIRQIAENRFGLASGISKMSNLLLQLQSTLQEADRKYKNFKLDYSTLPRKSFHVCEQIAKDLIHLHHSGTSHMVTTTCSSVSQLFLFLFLSEGKKPSEWSAGLFEDASKLLAVFANVESAEMPDDMDQLGNQILRHGENIDEFLKASPEKALEWLKGNSTMSHALDVFFDKHGHRGFSEMDLGRHSWKSDPTSFLPILKNMVKNKVNHKGDVKEKAKSEPKTDDQVLDSLSSTLKPMTRRLLKFILPTCRNAVSCREKSKSLLVRVVDQFKQQYRYLGRLMVEENLLPSESLIVHLTHHEIRQLISQDTGSSTILQKAMRRKKMFPMLEKLEFPEICVGLPQEMDLSIPVTITDTIQATPVSRGIARGLAKVCLSVEEASENIQPGDILITHGTDIAWSPFFPILGGVVTELGGLISHGAVVAREYGLPCIVGAVNATKIFKTGDYVILDAGKGTLSKAEEK